jgi:hypothetical protein
MTERWLTFDEAAAAVRDRIGGSVGRSHAILKAAISSGEVRDENPSDPVLLMADDGILGVVHGAIKRRPISEDDLIDWLGRQKDLAKPAEKRRVGRKPVHDWTAVENAAVVLMDENGDFVLEDRAWNSQARLEEALFDQFPEMGVSTLRERLPDILARWRKAKVEN